MFTMIWSTNDDVIKWKHFPRYWPFVRGIHRSPVNSLHKGQWRRALMFSMICALNKRLSKQSWGWWFETPTRSLWRHCNDLIFTGHLVIITVALWDSMLLISTFLFYVIHVIKCHLKDRAHLSTFKIFIFEKFSCFIVLVFFLVIVQSSELVSVWFCEKMTFFPIFLVTTSLRYMWAGIPWGCRPLAG